MQSGPGKSVKIVDVDKKSRYFEIMTENAANNCEERPVGQRPDTLAGFLASALDMEDEISNGVYKDYMDPDNWPVGMDLNVFQEIRKRLIILIEDTRRHRKIISGLIEQYGKDKTAR